MRVDSKKYFVTSQSVISSANKFESGLSDMRVDSKKYFVTSQSVMFALLSLHKGPEMSCFMLLMENLPMP